MKKNIIFYLFLIIFAVTAFGAGYFHGLAVAERTLKLAPCADGYYFDPIAYGGICKPHPEAATSTQQVQLNYSHLELYSPPAIDSKYLYYCTLPFNNLIGDNYCQHAGAIISVSGTDYIERNGDLSRLSHENLYYIIPYRIELATP